LSSLSDEQLIKSCIAGNREHYRLVYERYKDYVAGLVWRLVRDGEVARDLTQETFLKAFKALNKFRAESSFKTWLSRIAVNQCKDYLRGLKRRRGKAHVSLNASENEGVIELPAKDLASDPQRQVLQKELKTVVEAAMDKLSTEHKTVILLWQEGFSYDDIAAITKTSQETVGSRVYYAKMHLRNLLIPYIKGTG